MRSALSAAVDLTSFAADEVSWYDVPGVQLLGMVVGGLLLLAAIRSMFGGRR